MIPRRKEKNPFTALCWDKNFMCIYIHTYEYDRLLFKQRTEIGTIKKMK